MGNFRYFSDKEIEGLQIPLPAMLDMARGSMDARIKDPRILLTSTISGTHATHSAHYLGLAVDIGTGHLAEGFERHSYVWALVKALYIAGFERIEICQAHVHADIGKPPDFAAPILLIGKDT